MNALCSGSGRVFAELAEDSPEDVARTTSQKGGVPPFWRSFEWIAVGLRGLCIKWLSLVATVIIIGGHLRPGKPRLALILGLGDGTSRSRFFLFADERLRSSRRDIHVPYNPTFMMILIAHPQWQRGTSGAGLETAWAIRGRAEGSLCRHEG